MCIFPTHVDFSKLGKCNTKTTGAEGMDFLIRSGCLIAKLIAGKIQNLQAMRLIFIIYISCNSAYCGVKPQPVAVFTIRSPFP